MYQSHNFDCLPCEFQRTLEIERARDILQISNAICLLTGLSADRYEAAASERREAIATLAALESA